MLCVTGCQEMLSSWYIAPLLSVVVSLASGDLCVVLNHPLRSCERTNLVAKATTVNWRRERDPDGRAPGKIEGFDPELEEWPQYVERLEHFLEANGIVGEANAAKRRSTFLSVIGPAPYKLLRSLLSPARPTEKSFEELTEVLSNHYSPPPSEVMQRFCFNSRSRNAGESVAAYVADLCRLAEFCNFRTALNKMIRDRLVVGVNCESIQKRLLAEKDLTYE